MKASIIQQKELRLITAKSKSFPGGNTEAFNSIESHLETLRGRKFYGLVSAVEKEMVYYAGLVPENEGEEERFVELGFSITEIEGGPCARVKLLDWQSKIEQIGPTFGAMIGEHGIDSSRPQMEFYRSLTELHLLLPIPGD
jgi:hypothetical protein